MTRRFVFIKGIYDTMDLFTDELITECEKAGYEYLVLNIGTMDEDLKRLLEFSQEKIDAVITFNNLGYSLGEEYGKNLWHILGVTYVNILMDHPFHYTKPLEDAPENSLICCIDRNHVSYIRRFCPNIQRVMFLPHGGCANLVRSLMDKDVGASNQCSCQLEEGTTNIIERKAEDWSHRDIDVLYAGNLSRFLIEQLIPDFGQFTELDGAELSNRVLQKLVQQPTLTTEQVIEEELNQIIATQQVGQLTLHEQKRTELLTDEKLQYYINEFRFLDGFAVSFYREQAVRVLVEHGIKVHVLGIGWEKCDWTNNPNFIFEGKVEATEVMDYMMRSKIVLNTLTWFKDGSHDRIFNGMLCGAAVLSDTSTYLEEQFENHVDMELFRLQDIMNLPKLVTDLLADEEHLQQMACKGRQKAEINHIWGNRLDQIINYI